MRRSNVYSGIAAAVGMLVLILDGKTAIAGAQEGIGLCVRTVIPSLFPFFLLSMILTDNLSGIGGSAIYPVGRLFRIPQGSESILLTGFLGGYPVGAQAVSNGCQAGYLSHKDANRMLSFCSNAGPSFLFGMVAAQFPKPWYGWLLWGIQIISAYMVSLMIPPTQTTAVNPERKSAASMSVYLHRSLKVMASVCGWVVVFRVVIGFADRWFLWLLPSQLRVMAVGILELANGCCMLHEIESVGLRMIVCTGMLSFGGLCVTMQTASVIRKLSLKPYLLGKGLQTLISVTLVMLCQPLLPKTQRISISCIWIILFAVIIFIQKIQKRGGNIATVGV